jgi:HNH endonuclease
LRRDDVFARDGFRCVYCGEVCAPERLTVDHVQPRVRGGDHSRGNVVTACDRCNVRKGHRALADFLRDDPVACDHFFRLATHVWPRHLAAVRDALAHQPSAGRGEPGRGEPGRGEPGRGRQAP